MNRFMWQASQNALPKSTRRRCVFTHLGRVESIQGRQARAFQAAAFPWFSTQRYLEERIRELHEQLAAMDQPPHAA
jgi:hypothetical protein